MNKVKTPILITIMRMKAMVKQNEKVTLKYTACLFHPKIIIHQLPNIDHHNIIDHLTSTTPSMVYVRQTQIDHHFITTKIQFQPLNIFFLL